MVVHSPDAFEAKKAAAIAAAAAAAAQPPGQAARTDAQVPPSVLAAGAQAPPVSLTSQVSPAEEADLLGEEDATVHDFGGWDDGQALSHIRAEIHLSLIHI